MELRRQETVLIKECCLVSPIVSRQDFMEGAEPDLLCAWQPGTVNHFTRINSFILSAPL